MANPGEAQKALIIDGDPARTAALTDVLKNCGYGAIGAEDAMSAQMLIDSEQFDVILCQETIPGGSGVDILKALRGAHPEIPFVIMSDNPASPGVTQAMALGAVDSFTTPNEYKNLYPKLAAIQSSSIKGAGSPAPKMEVHPVELPPLTPSPSPHESANIDMILDVPVSVNAVLGETTMKIADLLQLGPGSVVELNKRAGEPVDLYVNEKLVAVGEVVVVNETFGVRITEVLDPKQRIQALS